MGKAKVVATFMALVMAAAVVPAAYAQQRTRDVFKDVSDIDGTALFEADRQRAEAERIAAEEEAARIAAEQAEAAREAEIAAEWYAEPSYGWTDAYSASYAPSDGLTREGGVNYHDGRRETYYSSSVLYHYRTPEWTVDDEGFYRDSEGRYVVAASDLEQGTVFEGSKGTCVVLDTGCAAGTTDYYVDGRWS